jgi:2-methylcitrate dehydratase PrpD
MPVYDFIHDLQWEDLPETTQREGIRVLLDTLGAAIVGRSTKISQVMHDHAVANHSGKGGFLWFDGREVSPLGAALANGMTVNAIGIYGGHPLAKGTVSSTALAALLAILPENITGKELLTRWVLGLEVALRAGVALHSQVNGTHTACTWNVLGATAIAARQMGLTALQTKHALGIAEYTAPVAPIHRTTAYPSMLRTGAGWAAMAGIEAALLAKQNFEGGPALSVEGKEVASIWADAGQYWHLSKYYYKPYTVCRWMQASMDAALALRGNVLENLKDIKHIRVHSFAVATNKMAIAFPQNMEEAQFNLQFGVAALLVYGALGKPATFEAAFKNADVIRLFANIETLEDEKFTAIYPAQRLARVSIEMQDGRVYRSGNVEEKWAASAPPSDEALSAKFRVLTQGELSEKRLTDLEKMVWDGAGLPQVNDMLQLIIQPK